MTMDPLTEQIACQQADSSRESLNLTSINIREKFNIARAESIFKTKIYSNELSSEVVFSMRQEEKKTFDNLRDDFISELSVIRNKVDVIEDENNQIVVFMNFHKYGYACFPSNDNKKLLALSFPMLKQLYDDNCNILEKLEHEFDNIVADFLSKNCSTGEYKAVVGCVQRFLRQP